MIFKVKGQELKVESPDVISEGAVNFVTFELKCDKSWEEFSKTVRFSHEDGSDVYDMPDIKEGIKYYIPAEVLHSGRVFVGVLGVFGVEHIATTVKAYFAVDKAIDGGKTPTVTDNAYAKYVSDVTEQRTICEEARKVSLDCLEQCRQLEKKVQTSALSATESSQKCKRLMQEVSGMLDSVGELYRKITDITDELVSIKGGLGRSEIRRDTSERARGISERQRHTSEEQRRERENEREAAENRRTIAENVRAMCDAERNKKLQDLSKRLDALEEHRSKETSLDLVTLEAEKMVSVNDPCFAKTESISIFGKSSICDGRICGVGEDGSVSITVDGQHAEIPVSEPLYSVGDICDELVVDADGGVTLKRRISRFVLDSDTSVIIDSDGVGKNLFAVPLNAPVCERELGMSSSFSYGEDSDGDCVWVGGDYLFFRLDSSQYPDIESFEKKMSLLRCTQTPFTVIYPLPSEKTYSEGTAEPICVSAPFSVEAEGKLALSYRRDLLQSVARLNERLETLENRKEEKLCQF